MYAYASALPVNSSSVSVEFELHRRIFAKAFCLLDPSNTSSYVRPSGSVWENSIIFTQQYLGVYRSYYWACDLVFYGTSTKRQRRGVLVAHGIAAGLRLPCKPCVNTPSGPFSPLHSILDYCPIFGGALSHRGHEVPFH